MKILIVLLIIVAEVLHYYLHKATYFTVTDEWKKPVIWIVGHTAYVLFYLVVLYFLLDVVW